MTNVKEKPVIDIVGRATPRNKQMRLYHSVDEIITDFGYCLTEEEIISLKKKLNEQRVKNDYEHDFPITLKWVKA